MIKSIQKRQAQCIHPAANILAKSIDLHSLLILSCGSKDNELGPEPYDDLEMALYGREEFKQIVAHVSTLPYVRVCKNIRINAVLSDRIHDNIKKAIVSTVWGDNFRTVGLSMFKIVDGQQKGSYLSELTNLPQDLFVSQFMVDSNNFSLETSFSLCLGNSEQNFNVRLDEEKLWEALYSDESMYKLVGKEGSIILDFVYNIGGSEAIAETYFKVLEAQRQDNQNPDTIDMRTLISYVIPVPSQCPKSIKSIAEIYSQGDLKKKVKSHRTNIFTDERERASRKYVVGKAIDNFNKKRTGCPYID